MSDVEKQIGETIRNGKEYLKISSHILNMQEAREEKFDVRKFSKKKIYAIVGIATIVCGSCCALKTQSAYTAYQQEQLAKQPLYTKRFEDVKKEYFKGNYYHANNLSDKLMDDLGDEWFFSVNNELYKDVKQFDKQINKAVWKSKWKETKEWLRDIFSPD